MTPSRALWMIALLLVVSGCAMGPRPGQGDKAPSFTAALDTGDKVTLESLMGEKGMILYFYPKDETPGCIKQACGFRDKLIDFNKKGYDVVGVSQDTPESHKAFRLAHNLPFRLISDPERTIATLYNVPMATDPNGTVGFQRTTFVLSKDGVIRRRFEVEDPSQQVILAAEAIEQPF